MIRDFPTSIEEATAVQERLRSEVVLTPPPGFAPRLVAGLDVSMERDAEECVAGIVVLELPTFEVVDQATAAAPVPMPYVPGFLAFRELPALAAAFDQLTTRPDALIFDGQGLAHPRRFGVACYGGLLFGLPSVGCAKSILVGRHEPLPPEQWSRGPLVHRRETVGTAIRLRARTNPVFVSPGHLIDVEGAVALVTSVSTGFREPETTRRAHRLVNAVRRARKGGA